FTETFSLVVDALVESELVYAVRALLGRAGNPDRAAAFDFGDLSDDATDGARCGGDDNRLTRLRLANVGQADVRRHTGHAERSDGCRDRRDRRIELAQLASARKAKILPAVVAHDEIAGGKRGIFRLDHLADRTAHHHLPNGD